MELENNFTVPAGIDEAWAAFNDLSRIVPCFPGATLQEFDGDSFTGTVKVKLGPISLTYKGKGNIVSRDEKAHIMVIEASGRDARGNGTASATVTGTLTADGADKTSVKMVTDMTVTGRPAQFGRGVMADVSDKIIGQFSDCLANKLGDNGGPAEEASPAGSSGPGAAKAEGSGSSGASAAKSESATATVTAPSAEAITQNGASPRLATAPEPTRSEVDAIDLLDTAGAPVLKRLAPVLLGLLVLFILIRRVRKARRAD
ncbi:SRPBCC family protein [Pseudonocardia eucalypti]|uniref:SRPBCC family protein n=1 Tax=Pseudonocardia eucalypti TaxID=648755 RepID=A0ABP9PFE3_9PSEU|nr:carbon monoxide dehydrogenase subunit G [Pseudonocardia eucalypti]